VGVLRRETDEPFPDLQLLDRLDLSSERDALHRAAVGFQVEIEHHFALGDDLHSLFKSSTRVLHFTGHGTVKGLVFEGSLGEAVFWDVEQMVNLVRRALEVSDISLLFISACESQYIAEEIIKQTEIPFVIAVRTGQGIAEDISPRFVERFYAGIFSHETVAEAFKSAQAHIQSMTALSPQRRARQLNKFILISQREGSDLFPLLPCLPSESQKTLELHATKSFPVICEKLYGREREIVSVLHMIQEHQLVLVYGDPGIGKTSFLIHACSHLTSRNSDIHVYYMQPLSLDEYKTMETLENLYQHMLQSLDSECDHCSFHLANDTSKKVFCFDGLERWIDIMTVFELGEFLRLILSKHPGSVILSTCWNEAHVFHEFFPAFKSIELKGLDQDAAGRLYTDLLEGIQRPIDSLEDLTGNPALIRDAAYGFQNSSSRHEIARNFFDIPVGWDYLESEAIAAVLGENWAVTEELVVKISGSFFHQAHISRTFCRSDLHQMRKLFESKPRSELWLWLRTTLKTIKYFASYWDSAHRSFRMIYGLASKEFVKQLLFEDKMFMIRLSDSRPDCLALSLNYKSDIRAALIEISPLAPHGVVIDRKEWRDLESFLENYSHVQKLWSGIEKMYI